MPGVESGERANMGERLHHVAAATLLLLVAAACGARIVPLSQQFQSGQGGIGGNNPGQPIAVPTGIGSLLPTIPGGSINPGGGGPRTGFVPGGSPQKSCTGGGATDVGVTATSIKLGAVIMLTGAFPGQFDPARDAVDAYFKMVNAQGGICGRKVQWIAEDDNGDPALDANAAKKLLNEDKVFAFVGNNSPYDDGMVNVICPKRVPDITFPFSERHTYCKDTFAVGMGAWRHIGEGASGSTYLNKVNNIKKLAMFWVREADVSKVSAWAFEAAMLKLKPDLQICFETETSVFETGFRQYVSQMEDKCGTDTSQLAVWTLMENNNNIRLAKAMREQSYNPKVYGVTFSSYLPSFIDQAEGATDGAWLALPFIPLERCGQRGGRPVPPCSHPALDTYIRALHAFRPGFVSPGSFGPFAWTEAALFTEAAFRCGAQLTRTCVNQQLRAINSFSAGGFVAPKPPRDQTPYHSDLLVQVRNGRFVETGAPPGFKGPSDGPDFWDDSRIFNWRDYYCAHKARFSGFTANKDKVIKC
jgi:ABC-type branched-subunit amino acid transport system substrate-binding protein